MITKRQLGIGVVALGALAALVIVGVDLVGAGQWGGFGPLQRIGIGLAVAGALVGGVLISRGNRPA